MKLQYFLFGLFSLTFSAAQAAHVPSSVARQVATHYYSNKVGTTKTFSLANADTTSLFVFNATDGAGFVLVSASNTARPILGYSPDGSFSTQNMPEGASAWIANVKNQIAYSDSASGTGSSAFQSQWSALQSSNVLRSSSVRVIIGPLLTSTWSQTYPYNSLCPTSDSLGQAVTGCVATAMSQIMYYWKYPDVGFSLVSYTDDKFGDIYTDFSSSYYQWADMTDNLDSTSTQQQIDAVAKLIADCGVAIQSYWGTITTGTGARLVTSTNYPKQNVQYALPTYFGYDKSEIYSLRQSSTTDSIFNRTLINEITAGHLFLIDGVNSSATGGHCFVCDGYDSDGFFHFNFGWGGSCNGYYVRDSIVPFANETADFSYQQEALLGITPPASVLESRANSIRQTSSSATVSVSPVPATGSLQISLTAAAQLQLLSVAGQPVLSVSAPQGSSSLNVSGVAPGVYFLRALFPSQQKSVCRVVLY